MARRWFRRRRWTSQDGLSFGPRAAAMRNPEREIRQFRARGLVASAFVLSAFAVLVARFAWLQVVRHEAYRPGEQVRFLTQVQCLLDGGSFSGTYKYALLLALADLAVEQGTDDVAELALSTDVIAEKFIEYYWDHCRPFVALAAPAAAQTAAPASEVATSSEVPLIGEAPPPPPAPPAVTPSAPKASKAKAEKVVALLAAVYGQVDGKLPALRADEAAWGKLLKAVRTVVQSTPLWKLQTIAEAQWISPDKVDLVVMGNVLQAGLGQNPARQAAINGEIPQHVPAMTVNVVCGSGMEAVITAVQKIKAGDAEILVAGGMENMSQAPYVMTQSRWGQRMGHGQVFDVMIRDGLWCSFSDTHMGITAENVAKKFSISREEQDAYAAASQAKAERAIKSGRFKDEIVPVPVPQKKGNPVIFDTDEFPRFGTTAEALAKPFRWQDDWQPRWRRMRILRTSF